MRTVHFLVPDNIHNPHRPSGGNVYNRRIIAGLRASGWSVFEYAIPGSWPRPDSSASAALINVLAGLPDDALVLLDGLIASTVPDVLAPQASRLRLVILLHMPLGNGLATDELYAVRTRERTALSVASAIIATSTWTKRWLCEQYALQPRQIHVAIPGTDAASPATGTAAGSELLCIAAVTPLKGHDVLLAALETISDLPWHCSCVGSLQQDLRFVDHLQRQAIAAGIDDRVHYTGTLQGADLAGAYARADVLVLASRRESFGMVTTEALARGLPVIATAVGGIAEALGHDADDSLPGLLVPPDAPGALGASLRAWLTDPGLRTRLRHAAGQRRTTLSGWSVTVEQVSQVLMETAARSR
ncbi:MAG: glycosyltransferase family 4 protein [Gammaproteobacteria bacterium]